MQSNSFSILITTKNRKDDLAFTLSKIQYLLNRDDVNCIVCDDGSTDGTSVFIQDNFPNIQLIRNIKSEGLIYSRNRLLNLTTTEFAICLDDDLHFITENPLEIIQNFFSKKPKIAVLSFRIFWDLEEPKRIDSDETSYRMRSFVGCGHVWRMEAWRDIPDYPSWFVFYGEEDFASYQLFKKKWEVYYLPEVLVNHRVDVKNRKKNSDYSLRLQRSLRSGWYLYFLFYPFSVIPKKMIYTIWMQFKLKVFKGDLRALKAIMLALCDLLFSIPRIMINSNRLSVEEYKAYQKLGETKLYWEPQKK